MCAEHLPADANKINFVFVGKELTSESRLITQCSSSMLDVMYSSRRLAPGTAVYCFGDLFELSSESWSSFPFGSIRFPLLSGPGLPRFPQ
jgi:hypothetical protein